MAQVTLQLQGDVPFLSLAVPGGIVMWQDWMSDSNALLLTRENSETPNTGVLLSLNSAQPLMKFSMTPDLLRALSNAQVHALFPAALAGETAFEASLVKREAADPTGLFFEGIRHQTRGELKEALECYRGALAQTPTLPRVSNLQGLCYRLLGQTDEAEKAYLRETEINPGSPDAFCNLGILYSKTSRAGMARPMLEKSLEKNQLYWNGLLQLSKFILEAEGPDSRLVSSLNHRLSVCYHELPQVQEYILAVVQKKGMTLRDYLDKIRADTGFLADSTLLALMKRVEDFRMNGAYLAAARGYSMLFKRATPDTPLENFLNQWVSQRLETLSPLIPSVMKELFQKILAEINPGRFPQPGATAKSAVPPQRATNFTGEEFFELVLQNVMRDGQITPEEMNIVFRLKNALRINEETHRIIFNKVEQTLSSNPLVDDPREFSPVDLFRQILRGVTRDGVIDTNEKKLLNIAREALDILPKELESLVAEVKRES